MKNGLFNLIRGIAFCFVLSIICLLGRVDLKADTIPNGTEIWNSFEKYVGHDWSNDTLGVNNCSSKINQANWIVFAWKYNYGSNNEDTQWDLMYLQTNDQGVGSELTKKYCVENDCTYLSGSWYLKNGYIYYYSTSGHTRYGSFPVMVYAYHTAIINSYNYDRTSNTRYYKLNEVTVLFSSDMCNEPQYDSTLGYLDNCIRKCMNQLSYSDSNGGFHSIVDVITDNLLGINSSFNFEGLDGVDCYSWLDKTTSGKSFDSVEVYISLFKEGSLVKENSFILEGYPLYYDVSWKSLDSAISGLDLLTLKYNYQIWFRPLSANSYGDWVYFDCEYNRVSERIQSLVSHILDGDIINSIDDFKLTVENCQFGIVQGDYNKPSDVPPSSIVPNVLYNGVYTQIYKPTISDDDKDNILQQIPDSSTSYTEINNNITNIQNGGENGESLIDKMGDLLSFFTNFLTFIYNFINLILSPLSFLPGWLKSLLSMSIIAFIVICVIKTLRG